MKKLFAFILVLGLSIFCFQALGAELTQSLNFSKASLIFDKEKEFDMVKFHQAHLLTETGKPALPVKNIFLALPDKAEVTGVEIIYSQTETLPQSYYIFPAQPSIPLSKTPDPNSFVQPLPQIYNSSVVFPESPVKFIKTGSLGGKRIAVLQVCPLSYIPAQKKLIFYETIQFKLNYTIEDQIPSVPKRTQKAEGIHLDMVKRIVENPQQVSSSYLNLESDGGQLEYLIITDEELAPSFQELVDWKIKKGIPSAIRTKEWIVSNYSGREAAERIRNYLKVAYQDSGCVWVLLGGDTDVIPCRYAYIELQTEMEDIPADLYYSDLDGNWDADNDHIFGELEDSLDMFPDVFVGRAPASTISEVEIFVSKVLDYEKNAPSDYQLKMLFFAEYSDERTDDGISKDMIDDYYVPSRFDPIVKLYERDGTESAQAVLDSMGNGFNFLNHAGHAYYYVLCTGPDNIWTEDFDTLTNAPRFSGVLYSIGCWPAAIDYDCIAEHFVKNPDGGGFFVGNSRYGWYTPSLPGYGSSDLFDQQFFASMFNRGFHSFGQILADSKIQFAAEANQANDFRWIEFDLILLGDPEMPLWTDSPQSLVVDFPDTVPIGSTQFQVTVAQSSPVEDALVCLMKEGEIWVSGRTGLDGYISFSIDPASAGTLHVTVTKPDFYPFEGYSVVESDLPFVTYKDKTIDDGSGNADGIINPGEEITLNLTLKNYGNQTANGVEAKLRTDDSYVTITDSTGSFGDLSPEDEASDSYVFEVASACSDNHSICFDLEITDLSHTWSAQLPLMVGTPVLSYCATIILDGPGGDGVPNPDETVDLRIVLQNSGLGDAHNSFARLSTNDTENIQILSDSVSYGEIPNQDCKSPDSCFTIYIDPSCPIIHGSWLYLDLGADDYSSLDSFWLLTGGYGFADDMEGGEGDWSKEGASKWHLTTHRSHSENTSWYCGEEGSWIYSSDFTALLYSPQFITLPPHAELSFWAWYEIEAGFDYSYCEIWADGRWHTLCMMTGESGGWVKKTFDLSEFYGNAVTVRFTMFSDDDDYQYEGLYIDDFQIAGVNFGICGDVNADLLVDVVDIVYFINYLFRSGPAPNPMWVGDVNEDGLPDVVDVVYLINYCFKDGPPPCEE
jgi:hypothetical protein